MSDTNSNGAGQERPWSTLPPRSVMAVQQLVANQIRTLARMAREAADERRDIEKECGHPKGIQSPQFYQELYDSGAIPSRVVEVLPRECWQVTPQVYEVEDAEVITPFEEAWDNLSRSLYGEHNYYQDEMGACVWEYLKRIDELSGIGSYGILLLGLDDDTDLRMPLPYAPSEVPTRKLLFIECFPESLAEVTQYETSKQSPRYNLPTQYLVTFNDPESGGIGAPAGTAQVHWSRVIHVADNRRSNKVHGRPRMQPVLSHLLDLKKLYGGSAEMYWQGAFPGIAAHTLPQLGGDVEVDVPAMRDAMEQYFNGLQRWLLGMGIDFHTLSPTVVDPSSQINAQIEAICIQLGIPVRVFKGSERGELASTQDDQAWNDRLRQRQSDYISPHIIGPFVSRLISLGVLPRPRGFSIWWPDLTSQTQSEKASVAVSKTAALAQYVGANVESLIPPLQYLTTILGMNEEEALSILDAANAVLEGDTTVETGGSPLLGLVGGITGMIELFKLAKEGGLTPEQLKQQIMLFFKVDEAKAQEIIGLGLGPLSEGTATAPREPMTPAPSTSQIANQERELSDLISEYREASRKVDET